MMRIPMDLNDFWIERVIVGHRTSWVARCDGCGRELILSQENFWLLLDNHARLCPIRPHAHCPSSTGPGMFSRQDVPRGRYGTTTSEALLRAHAPRPSFKLYFRHRRRR